MSKNFSLGSSLPKRKEKERQITNSSGIRQHLIPHTTALENSAVDNSIENDIIPPCVHTRTGTHKKSTCISKILENDKPGDTLLYSDEIDYLDVSRLTEDLTRKIFKKDDYYCTAKRENEYKIPGIDKNYDNSVAKEKRTSTLLLGEAQTQQIKKILVDCLQNIDCNCDLDKNTKDKIFCRKAYVKADKNSHNENISSIISSVDPMLIKTETTKTSLLRSYLSGSNPAREEYISKRRNVSNSLISTDSVHHSIFLESGRERRQCLLQYLSNVVGDGQVVIYVNSIPGAEALMTFLQKHGFQANAMHPNLLLAESNWILSEFSLQKFSVLICAEDHYHSCPAHFRWVKTIINYELPICNSVENWSIRNGIVEFSDNLPVHIYTFIKKTCPLDHELVKLLRLDSQEDQELLPVPQVNVSK